MGKITGKSRRRSRPARRRWRDYLTAFLLLVCALLALAIFARQSETSLTGRAHVADGDSLTIGSRRIRLEGIDAPEFGQQCRTETGTVDCGRRARQYLIGRIGDAPVVCRGWQEDQYGRLLAVCQAWGTDLNAAMVLGGWAIAYGGYEAEESRARAEKRGLWALDFDDPDDWRRLNGRNREPNGAGGLSGAATIRRALTALADWLTSWLR